MGVKYLNGEAADVGLISFLTEMKTSNRQAKEII